MRSSDNVCVIVHKSKVFVQTGRVSIRRTTGESDSAQLQHQTNNVYSLGLVAMFPTRFERPSAALARTGLASTSSHTEAGDDGINAAVSSERAEVSELSSARRPA